MDKIAIGLYIEGGISKDTIDEYKKAYQKVSKPWKKRLENDRWKIALVKSSSIKGGKRPFMYLPAKRLIRINATTKPVNDFGYPEKQIARAFSFYIKSQYEKYGETYEYKELLANYSYEKDLIAGMYDCKDDIFAGMIKFYFDYTEELAQSNNCTHIYPYIKEWMTGEVFKLPKIPADLIVPITFERNVTKNAAEIFIEATKKIPTKVRKHMAENNSSIILKNDDRYDKQYSQRELDVSLFETKIIHVKSYQSIEETLMLKVGLYVYHKWIADQNAKDVQKTYVDENKQMRFYFSPKSKDITAARFYSLAFQQMIINPEILQEKAPNAYEVMKKLDIWD